MTAGVRRYVVSGKVQGVGYRYFTLRVARELKLNGWVRNLPDGNVEAVASGPAARLKRFDAELRIGPPRAEVRTVAVEEGPVDGKLEGFHIR
jgi:acylphosphatase